MNVNLKNTTNYSDLLSNFEVKLAGWKTKHLSREGRVTLIKSSLASLPCISCSVLSSL